MSKTKTATRRRTARAAKRRGYAGPKIQILDLAALRIALKEAGKDVAQVQADMKEQLKTSPGLLTQVFSQ